LCKPPVAQIIESDGSDAGDIAAGDMIASDTTGISREMAVSFWDAIFSMMDTGGVAALNRRLV
jgi:hypothetical protein